MRGNKKNGTGISVRRRSNSVIYSGLYRNDLLIQGVIFSEELIEKGNFKNEVLHGEGYRETLANSFKGRFTFGQPEGRSKIEYFKK